MSCTESFWPWAVRNHSYHKLYGIHSSLMYEIILTLSCTEIILNLICTKIFLPWAVRTHSDLELYGFSVQKQSRIIPLLICTAIYTPKLTFKLTFTPENVYSIWNMQLWRQILVVILVSNANLIACNICRLECDIWFDYCINWVQIVNKLVLSCRSNLKQNFQIFNRTDI